MSTWLTDALLITTYCAVMGLLGALIIAWVWRRW